MLRIFDSQDSPMFIIQDEAQIAAIHLDVEQIIGAEQLRVKCGFDPGRHLLLQFGSLPRIIG
jgi:hypothetical protein